jgi:hypothetical protein
VTRENPLSRVKYLYLISIFKSPLTTSFGHFYS